MEYCWNCMTIKLLLELKLLSIMTGYFQWNSMPWAKIKMVENYSNIKLKILEHLPFCSRAVAKDASDRKLLNIKQNIAVLLLVVSSFHFYPNTPTTPLPPLTIICTSRMSTSRWICLFFSKKNLNLNHWCHISVDDYNKHQKRVNDSNIVKGNSGNIGNHYYFLP